MEKIKQDLILLEEELNSIKDSSDKSFVAYEIDGQLSVSRVLYNYIMTLAPLTRPQEEHNAKLAILGQQELETAIFILKSTLD